MLNLEEVLKAEPGLLREVELSWIPIVGFTCKIIERDPQPEFIQVPLRVLVASHKSNLATAIMEACHKI